MNIELTRYDLMTMLCTNHFEHVNVFSDVTLDFSISATILYCGCFYGKHDIVYITFLDTQDLYSIDKEKVKHIRNQITNGLATQARTDILPNSMPS